MRRFAEDCRFLPHDPKLTCLRVRWQGVEKVPRDLWFRFADTVVDPGDPHGGDVPLTYDVHVFATREEACAVPLSLVGRIQHRTKVGKGPMGGPASLVLWKDPPSDPVVEGAVLAMTQTQIPDVWGGCVWGWVASAEDAITADIVDTLKTYTDEGKALGGVHVFLGPLSAAFVQPSLEVTTWVTEQRIMGENEHADYSIELVVRADAVLDSGAGLRRVIEWTRNVGSILTGFRVASAGVDLEIATVGKVLYGREGAWHVSRSSFRLGPVVFTTDAGPTAV